MSRAPFRAFRRFFAAAAAILGGSLLMNAPGEADDDLPAGPRAAAWKAVQEALDEGKPQTALRALEGVEAAAIADRAWAEAARAIATRVFAETGDRPADDPQRIVRLAGEIARAPAETRGVLEAIRANWTWGYYLQNQWRFRQRTQVAPGRAAGDAPGDLEKISEWDLPTIVAEIRARFAAALAGDGGAGDADRHALQSLPIGDWNALFEKGALSDAYRPTVWDVVARSALEFAASGERGLIAPEDAFELDAASPALGSPEEFLAWRPESDDAVSDKGSPLIEAAGLYRRLLEFHRADADQTALLAADLDRILWAADAAVGEGVAERKETALVAFSGRAGGHETAALAAFHLASLLRERGDLVAARRRAAEAAGRWPQSPGGGLCGNLVVEIDSREIALATEQAWAAPWPVVRVTYRNVARVHLRLCRADWEARLLAGKPHAGWLDDADRKAVLELPAVRTHAADLPVTEDHRQRTHDIPVDAAFDAATLEPGAYWVIASHGADFAEHDNVVAVSLVWVTRLGIVSEQHRQTFPRAERGPAALGRPPRPRDGEPLPLAGHVVDLGSGEPVAGAEVTLYRRRERNPRGFEQAAKVATDDAGRFELAAELGVDLVVVAGAPRDGRRHQVTTAATNVWPNAMPATSRTIVMLTDRGIHRPGQTVFYKGIATEADRSAARYRAVALAEVTVTLRDANGREVASAAHTTNANGSFHGSFALPAGGLPGQWSLAARGPGEGSVGLRVEEYKRPKFLVRLAPPEIAVPLGEAATLRGRAETYTGLAVADATVRWRVERVVRFPIWCRFAYPWLPFDGGARRIARGTARTGPDGGFTISFPALPDRALPKESLPVFTFRVVADVTDPGGETRSDERSVNVGYTDVEAVLAAEEWQATADGRPAAVPLTVTTTTLDGQPRAAAGSLEVHRLVQPAAVPRGDLLADGGMPPWRRPRAGERGAPGRRAGPEAPAAAEAEAGDPGSADPERWANGERVFVGEIATAAATGQAVREVALPAGIYRATFEIPAAGAVPAVKATRLVEVVDPAAERCGVKRAFAMRAPAAAVSPGQTYRALIGTGYESGRALVEISQSGDVLERFWTAPGRTQWPVSFAAAEANRGGFTVRAWLVRDGRLHVESRTVDVPWTDKQLAVRWERFTRRTQPGAREVWRARISTEPAGPDAAAAPVAAEFLALLYDQSLDALAPHAWPGGLGGILRRESGWLNLVFTNSAVPLHHLRGSFAEPQRAVPEMTYRTFREPFGSPFGGMGGFGGRLGRGGNHTLLMATAAAPAAEMAAADAAPGRPQELRRKAAMADDKGSDRGDGARDGVPARGAAAPPPRKNMVETAFFLPVLSSDADGMVTIEFTLPDTLTTWQFRGLAHDPLLRSGTLVDTCIASKDLMVEPLVPRFLREGDLVQLPVKVSNASTGRLAGSVRLELYDARTDADRGGLVDGDREQVFDLAAGESRPVVFTVRVADGTGTLRYLATGSAGRALDGEEAFLPVLPRRVSVTETVPITIRGPGERAVSLERLAASAGTEIRSESLVVQAVANPAWYAVLALPAIMEQADESTETLFTRLYANTLARHLATSDPRIERVFAQWRLAGAAALESPLERNTALVQTLLAETPWVRDAVDEREARARIALVFDANRAAAEVRAALERLESLRSEDGGWPWFPGGRTCDSVTLGIVAGFGRLRAAGVPGEVIDPQPALATLGWLDGRLVEEKERALAGRDAEPDDLVLTPIGVSALYARSFFTAESPAEGAAAEAHRWALAVGRKSWMRLDHRRSQGELAIALFRAGDRDTARSIVDSLRQRAVAADVPPGEEPASWQGMWWRDRHPAWWSWVSAPIATQAIMIEAFDEVAGDAAAVEALKVWLLAQKRTSAWPGSRATADAVAALLGRGADLLGGAAPLELSVGGARVVPENVEAGTGFFETRLVRGEITPAAAAIRLVKPEPGLAFAGVHWQYLDDISNVPAAGREELAIEKKLFVKTFTKAGPRLEPAGEGRPVEVGDEIVVRLVVTSDRDYEFLELADHRPSLTEPVDGLSGWRFGDGVGWYLAIRDASTRFYFERLPRGTHVLEYSLRAAHRGAASSGFAHLQSRYAPEFSARSRSIRLEVR